MIDDCHMSAAGNDHVISCSNCCDPVPHQNNQSPQNILHHGPACIMSLPRAR